MDLTKLIEFKLPFGDGKAKVKKRGAEAVADAGSRSSVEAVLGIRLRHDDSAEALVHGSV